MKPEKASSSPEGIAATFKSGAKLNGLGLPAEMVSCTLSDCAPQFALWSFTDLGYVTCYVTCLLATGGIEGTVGERFVASRMGPKVYFSGRRKII